MLVRLLYASRATEKIDESVIRNILETSRKSNPDEGITGVLCVCQSGLYLQALEGAREKVNGLYSRILADARHTDVTLLAYDEITERRFPGWSMGRVDLTKVNPVVVLKYSETPRLDPMALSGAVAHRLLEDLMEAAAIVGGS